MSAERAGTLWCELAWLGGERAEAGVVLEVDDDRIASVTAGVDIPPPGATELPGPDHPGNGQRPLTRLPTGPARAHSGRSRGLLDLAIADVRDRRAESIRTTISPWPGRPSGRWRWRASPRVGEFHYLHHGPGGARYEDPNALGLAVIAAAREAGIRITLLDTCYLHGGIEPGGGGRPASVLGWQRRGMGEAGR